MEKENIMEQPKQVQVQGEASQDIIGTTELEKGSILGKFKDAESLEKAYENLQKEFTKKCQALSSMQKTIEETKPKESETEFLKNNPEAKEFIDDLNAIVADDKLIENQDSPLKAAWDKYRQENFISKDTLAKDEEFLSKYIYSNDAIKQKILDEYFKQLNLNNIPPMIAKQVGSKSILTKNTKPTTFAEAGDLVKSILDK